jgi:hypothetical protein
MFPEELKVKLLQGAYLEQPLFGPTGKLPKVTREPRLPEVQPDQVETSVPVEPKQSNVPETVIDSITIKPDSSIVNPGTQEDEVSLPVLELEKLLPGDSLEVDSLKLETEKQAKIPAEDSVLPPTEDSQPDEILTKVETVKNDSLKVDSLKLKESKEKKALAEDEPIDIKVEQVDIEETQIDSTKSNDN